MKIRLIAVGSRKITVIKVMRDHLGFDLRGAKAFIEGAPVTFNASKELYDELTGDFLRRHGCVVINEDADADEEDYEEKSDYDYLCILAERLRHIPGTYGTDGGDVDRVLEIARKLKPKPELQLTEEESESWGGCSYCSATAGDDGVTFYFERMPTHWHDKVICGGCIKKRQSA